MIKIISERNYSESVEFFYNIGITGIMSGYDEFAAGYQTPQAPTGQPPAVNTHAPAEINTGSDIGTVLLWIQI